VHLKSYATEWILSVSEFLEIYYGLKYSFLDIQAFAEAIFVLTNFCISWITESYESYIY
jgi:hypothetical protein